MGPQYDRTGVCVRGRRLRPVTRHEEAEQTSVYKPRRGPAGETNPAHTLISDFQPLALGDNRFLLLKPPNPWFSRTWGQGPPTSKSARGSPGLCAVSVSWREFHVVKP